MTIRLMRGVAIAAALLALSLPLRAQDEQPALPSGTAIEHAAHQALPAAAAMVLHPIGIPPTRHGSGTSWMPDSAPMYGLMRQRGQWELMYHGAAHLAWDQMKGPRGDAKAIAPNWAMLVARRNLGPRNQLQWSAMLSLDAETVGKAGYPLLFQTGETAFGEPLRDHQHPHNFISELSATYTRALDADSAAFLYLAPVGEPALGPVTFMHRTFALDGPLAPLGHHWQDATHIAFGVATLGYQTRAWQVEGSVLTGREPGENRYRIESPEFDSVSARLSYNPGPDLALQVSHAFLNSPEALHPEDDAHRTTASAIYNRPWAGRGNLQSTFVWGRNRIAGRDFDSFLLEAQAKRDRGWSFYARYEHIRKNAEELVLPPPFPPGQVFALQQVTVGAVRDLPSRGDLQWGLGGQVVFSITPAALEPVYGSNPTGWLVFLRVHPKRMEHAAAAPHAH